MELNLRFEGYLYTISLSAEEKESCQTIMEKAHERLKDKFQLDLGDDWIQQTTLFPAQPVENDNGDDHEPSISKSYLSHTNSRTVTKSVGGRRKSGLSRLPISKKRNRRNQKDTRSAITKTKTLREIAKSHQEKNGKLRFECKYYPTDILLTAMYDGELKHRTLKWQNCAGKKPENLSISKMPCDELWVVPEAQRQTEAPYAVITVKESTSDGTVITFDASSSRDWNGRECKSFEWDFGDGTEPKVTESPQSPVHTFKELGIYSVKCTVIDLEGNMAMCSMQQVIGRKIQKDYFTVKSSVFEATLDQTVNFYAEPLDLGLKRSSYRWYFGDEPEPQTSDCPRTTHIFKKAGSYTVRVEVSENGLKRSASLQQRVCRANPNGPVIMAEIQEEAKYTQKEDSDGHSDQIQRTDDLNLNETEIEVTFDASKSVDRNGGKCNRFIFDFGDGSDVKESESGGVESHRYTVSGTYLVTVVVTDADGNRSTATMTHKIVRENESNDSDGGLRSFLSFGNNNKTGNKESETGDHSVGTLQCFIEPQVQCTTGPSRERGNLLYFWVLVQDATNVAKYEWNFGDGEKPQTSKEPKIDHIYNKAGSYPITVSIEYKNGNETQTADCTHCALPPNQKYPQISNRKALRRMRMERKVSKDQTLSEFVDYLMKSDFAMGRRLYLEWRPSVKSVLFDLSIGKQSQWWRCCWADVAEWDCEKVVEMTEQFGLAVDKVPNYDNGIGTLWWANQSGSGSDVELYPIDEDEHRDTDLSEAEEFLSGKTIKEFFAKKKIAEILEMKRRYIPKNIVIDLSSLSKGKEASFEWSDIKEKTQKEVLGLLMKHDSYKEIKINSGMEEYFKLWFESTPNNKDDIEFSKDTMATTFILMLIDKYLCPWTNQLVLKLRHNLEEIKIAVSYDSWKDGVLSYEWWELADKNYEDILREIQNDLEREKHVGDMPELNRVQLWFKSRMLDIEPTQWTQQGRLIDFVWNEIQSTLENHDLPLEALKGTLPLEWKCPPEEIVLRAVYDGVLKEFPFQWSEHCDKTFARLPLGKDLAPAGMSEQLCFVRSMQCLEKAPYAVIAMKSSTNSFDAAGSRDYNGGDCTKFIWDFGDGTKPQFTDEPEIASMPKEPGIYSVKCIVIDSEGNMAMCSMQQVIGRKNKNDYFTVKSSVFEAAPNQSVNFYAHFGEGEFPYLGREDLSYRWCFGDGTSGESDCPWKTHIFTKAGSYSVTVEVSELSDVPRTLKRSATLQQRVCRANPNGPAAVIKGFKAHSEQTDDGLHVIFDASESRDKMGKECDHFLFDFGDGNGSIRSEDGKVKCTYDLTGTYVVTVVAVDKEDNRRTATWTHKIEKKKKSEANSGRLSLFQKGLTRGNRNDSGNEQIKIVDNSGGALQWDITPQIQCARSLSIVGQPVCFSLPDQDGTNGAKYEWEFGDGEKPETSEEPKIDHIYTKPGSYSITVSIVYKKRRARAFCTHCVLPPSGQHLQISLMHDASEKRCDNDNIKEDQVEDVDKKEEDDVGHNEDERDQKDSKVLKFFCKCWPHGSDPKKETRFIFEFGDQNIPKILSKQSGVAEVEHEFKESGTYKVTVTAIDVDGSGVYATASVLVGDRQWEIQSARSVSIVGQPVSFWLPQNAPNGAKYQWDFDDGTTDKSKVPNIDHIYEKPGSYSITVSITDQNWNGPQTAVCTHCVLPPSEQYLHISLKRRPIEQGSNEDEAQEEVNENEVAAGHHDIQIGKGEVQKFSCKCWPRGSVQKKDTVFIFDFGDKSSPEKRSVQSIAAEVEHKFEESGTYQVTVTAIDVDGRGVYATASVLVGDDKEQREPQVFVEAEQKDIDDNGLQIIEFNTTGSMGMKDDEPIKFTFDFGDGNKGKTDKHGFKPGTYQVIVTGKTQRGNEAVARLSVTVLDDTQIVQKINNRSDQTRFQPTNQRRTKGDTILKIDSERTLSEFFDDLKEMNVAVGRRLYLQWRPPIKSVMIDLSFNRQSNQWKCSWADLADWKCHDIVQMAGQFGLVNDCNDGMKTLWAANLGSNDFDQEFENSDKRLCAFSQSFKFRKKDALLKLKMRYIPEDIVIDLSSLTLKKEAKQHTLKWCGDGNGFKDSKRKSLVDNVLKFLKKKSIPIPNRMENSFKFYHKQEKMAIDPSNANDDAKYDEEAFIGLTPSDASNQYDQQSACRANPNGPAAVIVGAVAAQSGSELKSDIEEEQQEDGFVSVMFDASNSVDKKGAECIRFRFDFGDGSDVKESENSKATHHYTAEGTYLVTVVVMDSNGNRSSASLTHRIKKVKESKESDSGKSKKKRKQRKNRQKEYEDEEDANGPEDPSTEKIVESTNGDLEIEQNVIGDDSDGTLQCFITQQIECSRALSTAGELVSFLMPDPEKVQYQWDFGDESDPVEGSKDGKMYHIYKKPGSYSITVSIKDNDGKGPKRAVCTHCVRCEFTEDVSIEQFALPLIDDDISLGKKFCLELRHDLEDIQINVSYDGRKIEKELYRKWSQIGSKKCKDILDELQNEKFTKYDSKGAVLWFQGSQFHHENNYLDEDNDSSDAAETEDGSYYFGSQRAEIQEDVKCDSDKTMVECIDDDLPETFVFSIGKPLVLNWRPKISGIKVVMSYNGEKYEYPRKWENEVRKWKPKDLMQETLKKKAPDLRLSTASVLRLKTYSGVWYEWENGKLENFVNTLQKDERLEGELILLWKHLPNKVVIDLPYFGKDREEKNESEEEGGASFSLGIEKKGRSKGWNGLRNMTIGELMNNITGDSKFKELGLPSNFESQLWWIPNSTGSSRGDDGKRKHDVDHIEEEESNIDDQIKNKEKCCENYEDHMKSESIWWFKVRVEGQESKEEHLFSLSGIETRSAIIKKVASDLKDQSAYKRLYFGEDSQEQITLSKDQKLYDFGTEVRKASGKEHAGVDKESAIKLVYVEIKELLFDGSHDDPKQDGGADNKKGSELKLSDLMDMLESKGVEFEKEVLHLEWRPSVTKIQVDLLYNGKSATVNFEWPKLQQTDCASMMEMIRDSEGYEKLEIPDKGVGIPMLWLVTKKNEEKSAEKLRENQPEMESNKEPNAVDGGVFERLKDKFGNLKREQTNVSAAGDVDENEEEKLVATKDEADDGHIRFEDGWTLQKLITKALIKNRKIQDHIHLEWRFVPKTISIRVPFAKRLLPIEVVLISDDRTWDTVGKWTSIEINDEMKEDDDYKILTAEKTPIGDGKWNWDLWFIGPERKSSDDEIGNPDEISYQKSADPGPKERSVVKKRAPRRDLKGEAIKFDPGKTLEEFVLMLRQRKGIEAIEPGDQMLLEYRRVPGHIFVDLSYFDVDENGVGVKYPKDDSDQTLDMDLSLTDIMKEVVSHLHTEYHVRKKGGKQRLSLDKDCILKEKDMNTVRDNMKIKRRKPNDISKDLLIENDKQTLFQFVEALRAKGIELQSTMKLKWDHDIDEKDWFNVQFQLIGIDDRGTSPNETFTEKFEVHPFVSHQYLIQKLQKDREYKQWSNSDAESKTLSTVYFNSRAISAKASKTVIFQKQHNLKVFFDQLHDGMVDTKALIEKHENTFKLQYLEGMLYMTRCW